MRDTFSRWLKGGVGVYVAIELLISPIAEFLLTVGLFVLALVIFATAHTLYRGVKIGHSKLTTNDRAQAVGIANFLLALVIGAVVSWITTSITDPLIQDVKATGTDPVATQSTNWIVIYLNNQPVVFLITAFFALVALSIFQREVLG